jgi:hypothetical protein
MEKWRHVFLRVISKEYPTKDHENWIKCQQLEPHIAPIIETEPVTVEEKGDWAQLLTNVGWYEWQMGRYNAAEKMLKKAVEIREKVLDRERKNTIQALGKMMLKRRCGYERKFWTKSVTTHFRHGQRPSFHTHERRQACCCAGMPGKIRRGRADAPTGA